MSRWPNRLKLCSGVQDPLCKNRHTGLTYQSSCYCARLSHSTMHLTTVQQLVPAKGSHIQSLHLHSNHLSRRWRTSSFFKSRCSIGELKLTAGDCSKEEIITFASSSRNIPCVSLLCDSLHVDMSWSQLLHHRCASTGQALSDNAKSSCSQ